MINLSDCIELGVLTKPHGVKGQLVLQLNNISFNEIQKMEQVFIVIDGLPVPFFIEEFMERSFNSILIKFDNVSSEKIIRQLCNCRVYLNKKVIAKKNISKLPISEFSGFSVIDKQSGKIGELESVLDFGGNIVMRIKNKHKEILLPLQSEIIVSYNIKKKEIHVNCPEGLLELYL